MTRAGIGCVGPCVFVEPELVFLLRDSLDVSLAGVALV